MVTSFDHKMWLVLKLIFFSEFMEKLVSSKNYLSSLAKLNTVKTKDFFCFTIIAEKGEGVQGSYPSGKILDPPSSHFDFIMKKIFSASAEYDSNFFNNTLILLQHQKWSTFPLKNP